MQIKHAGDAMFAGSVGTGTGGILLQLEPILTVAVLTISCVAGIYSILWNRIRMNNEKRKSNEQSKRNDS
ncbi:hypothetical protein LCGC14_2868710 [marine sediment metagenome]|uniref:Uncharacterized protein n=1 Tax=marine sediment metagenome TaxID=412755 RepID=A0A0F8Y3U1_9ZZZZ